MLFRRSHGSLNFAGCGRGDHEFFLRGRPADSTDARDLPRCWDLFAKRRHVDEDTPEPLPIQRFEVSDPQPLGAPASNR
jgi:hypothetical protein